MFISRRCVASFGVLLLAAPALAVEAVAGDQVDRIEARATATGGAIVVHGTRPPMFSVFRLTDPDRIVVDLAGADVSQAKAPAHPAIAGLKDVAAVQFQKGDTRVGRIVLSAAPSLSYQVKVEGNDVVIALASSDSPANPSPSALSPEVAPPEPASPSVAGSDPHLVERLVDAAQVHRPGHRILSAALLALEPLEVEIRTDGPVGEVAVLRLREPARLALDLEGFDSRGAKGGTARFGKTATGSRVVFDLPGGEPPRVSIRRSAKSLRIVAVQEVPSPNHAVAEVVAPSGPAPQPVAAAPQAPAAPTPRPVVAEPAPAAAPVVAPQPSPSPKPQVAKLVAAPLGDLRDLRVTGDSATQEIVLEVPTSVQIGQPTSVEGHGYELQLHGVHVPDHLRRTLDASAFGGPLSTVSSFNVGRSEARVVVSAAPGARQELTREGTTITWRFKAQLSERSAEIPLDKPSEAKPAEGGPAGEVQIDQSSGQVAGFTTAAAETGGELPRRTRYTGRRISLEFKDIDIQNLLRLFADISHKNVVVSDDVKGKVTIALRNVPWDQAFELVLKTHGLGKEENGNIIRVAPESQLETERKAALDAKKARDLLEPLRVRLIPVNYALAGEVSDKIKDVLSDRGVVTVDGRTNVLIVKDVAENLAKAEGMVRNLDTQTPQVLIESRIVEAATQFAREVGIQWGGNAGFAPSTANSTGLVFPSTATVAGAAGGSPNAGTAANPNYAVNLPAAIGQGAGGGLGFIFGSAGGAFNLNLRISALENTGVVKTVSAPKVATLDNQEASISQGVSIPFAQVSAAGVQTAFIEARLELKVTPHVTSDGSVLLKISATNNQPNAGITGANGQPSISRKEAKTQMLVRDGDTTVIGGIYTRATGVSLNEVPLFGKIPILGWLFKHRADSDSRTELLVFITPRILNRQQVVAAGN